MQQARLPSSCRSGQEIPGRRSSSMQQQQQQQHRQACSRVQVRVAAAATPQQPNNHHHHHQPARRRSPAPPRAQAPPAQSSSSPPPPPAPRARYMTAQDLELVRQNLVSRMAYSDVAVRQLPRTSVDAATAAATTQQRKQLEQQLGDQLQQSSGNSSTADAPLSAPLPPPAPEYHPSDGWRAQPHHLTADQLWARIRDEAKRDAEAEPTLASFLYSSVLAHASFPQALAFVLANKLASPTLFSTQLKQIAEEAYARDPCLIEAALADLQAVRDRDPACEHYSQALLHFKGYQAIQSHRVAHHLWLHGRRALALMLQSRISEAFHVDIHPAAVVGRGVLLDHATGVVIGETCVVGDNVSMLHHVTLGGSGVGKGVRHPRVGHGALLGAGVTVLGPVVLGAGVKVGAGSVVVTDLEPHSVAVGVPARVIKRAVGEPCDDMDQTGFLLDYVI